MDRKTRTRGMAVWYVALAALIGLAAAPAAFGYSQNLTNNGVVWNWGYEGDTYPTNEFFGGEKWLHDVQGAHSVFSFTTTGSTTNGIVNDMTLGNDGIGFKFYGGGTVLPITNVWTVEFRMRLMTTSNSYQGGLEFRQNSFGAGFAVRAHPTVVELRASGGAPSSAQAIGTNWHTYRITLVGTTSTLYMDTNNSPMLTVSGTRGAGDQIEFGDYGALINTGAVEYDYIRWAYGQAVGGAPIPEPSAATLLILGGCAALLRHRAMR